MIRVCSRTGGETTLHGEISLGKFMTQGLLFLKHINMPKLYRLLNVVGLWCFFSQTLFFYKKCNK